jgi:hypothetical protein
MFGRLHFGDPQVEAKVRMDVLVIVAVPQVCQPPLEALRSAQLLSLPGAQQQG